MNANREWRANARREVRRLAATGRPFTADDLYDTLPHPDGNHTPNARNNLIGQVFREMCAEGWIEPVGVVKSRQPKRKGGMIRVWRGLPENRLFA